MCIYQFNILVSIYTLYIGYLLCIQFISNCNINVSYVTDYQMELNYPEILSFDRGIKSCFFTYKFNARHIFKSICLKSQRIKI